MIMAACDVSPLQAERLTLYPCSAQIANLAYSGRRMMESLLNAHFLPDWLDDDGRALLSHYARQINLDPTMIGWGLWLIIVREQRCVIGSAGFKGKPSPDGAIEIGYGIAPSFRRQGYAFEAARALTQWAFAQPGVRRLTAEALYYNIGSIRILQKLGMRCTHHSGQYTKWELEK
jgi:ribosomal-protein-alanine N-acetyltransferase